MGFFERFFNVVHSGGEEAVCCPFPHHTANGIPYNETNPSAHVNLSTRVFHCKVCQEGFGETSFITKYYDCTYANATRLNKAFMNGETIDELIRTDYLDKAGQDLCASLGISLAVAKELNIVNRTPEEIIFPVSMNGKIIDIRKYHPTGTPKVKSRVGSIQGAVIPLDLWQESDKNTMTFICAGEKDMATTRSHGLNAITLTGGEATLPFSARFFKDRHFAIVYDNDDAGKIGAVKLASWLLVNGVASVRIVDKFHTVCVENKEDMTDYWNKYNGTKEQLVAWTKATKVFTLEDIVIKSDAPIISLADATTAKYLNKVVRSNIQVTAVADNQFQVPMSIIGTKFKACDKGAEDTMHEGEVRDWELNESTIQDILHLADGGFKKEDIDANAKTKLLHISPKERNISIQYPLKEVLYKASVTDMFESMTTDDMPMEYGAYSVGTRLESGKKYMCTYKLVPHPYKGQQLTMVILNAIPANDSISTFTINDETKAHLDIFRGVPGNISEKMTVLVNKVKGLLGYNGNNTLIELIDLSYHTVLAFNLGQFKNVRGYLDTLIVGESRVGKSSTAEALRKCYQLGTFTSLAGNSATIPGLVGGSNKASNGSMQTKAGLIPQNHKGLIIFEEFGKCNSNIVSELTDIRSSNEVRITRVSGSITLPAMVRMIALTNVKNTGNEIKSIASYPNGISIITDLVPTAEDIARYDLLCVLSDRGTSAIDPYWVPETPFEDAAYQTRVRWVWSRTPDQVIITPDVAKVIIDTANDLNTEYECHIKIFGTEAWKKLTRLSIAVAGYLVSTDATYEHIIVTKEHVLYASELFIRLYDNSTFRLREYVANERKYNTIDADGIALLQEVYNKTPALVIMLEQESRPSRNSLMASAGIETAEYNGVMSNLIKGSFVRLNGSDVLPTERFRLGMAQINKNTRLRAIGENDA